MRKVHNENIFMSFVDKAQWDPMYKGNEYHIQQIYHIAISNCAYDSLVVKLM